MTWIKEKPYEGKGHQGCINRPPVSNIAPLDMPICVGFGCAMITKDSEAVYMETPEDEEVRILREFEIMDQQDPDHDWRATLFAPLRGRVYQRHGENQWVLIDSNPGFA